MNLYLVHLGYYENNLGGVLENHFNIFVVAESFEKALETAKQRKVVRERKMHVDGMQRIEIVDGFEIVMERVSESDSVQRRFESALMGTSDEVHLGATRIICEKHRQLARS